MASSGSASRPSTISMEPPPTSRISSRPADQPYHSVDRQVREAGLVLAAEVLGPDAGFCLYSVQDHVAVRGVAHGRGGEHVELLHSEPPGGAMAWFTASTTRSTPAGSMAPSGPNASPSRVGTFTACVGSGGAPERASKTCN